MARPCSCTGLILDLSTWQRGLTGRAGEHKSLVVTVVVEVQKKKGRVFLQAIGVRIMPSHTLTRRVRAGSLRPTLGAIGGAHGLSLFVAHAD